MSLLKPTTNKMAFAKVGIYGRAGSGTRTATEIAIGLHKAIGSKKPIVALILNQLFLLCFLSLKKKILNYL